MAVVCDAVCSGVRWAVRVAKTLEDVGVGGGRGVGRVRAKRRAPWVPRRRASGLLMASEDSPKAEVAWQVF